MTPTTDAIAFAVFGIALLAALCFIFWMDRRYR